MRNLLNALASLLFNIFKPNLLGGGFLTGSGSLGTKIKNYFMISQLKYEPRDLK
jgi:hypothetical protein